MTTDPQPAGGTENVSRDTEDGPLSSVFFWSLRLIDTEEARSCFRGGTSGMLGATPPGRVEDRLERIMQVEISLPEGERTSEAR